MGQFLIVQSASDGAAQATFQRGLQGFERIAGLKPSACFLAGRLAIATYSKQLSPGTGLAIEPQSGRRVCEAGLSFYRGRRGHCALEELARDIGKSAGDGDLAARLNDLEGIFALASAAATDSELTVITDRLGSLHVYMAQLEGVCVVTTSALVAAELSGAGWDLEGCREFLATGTVFETRSLFRGVSKLRPACIHRFRDGCLRSMSRYWTVEAAMFDHAPVRGTVATLAESLEEAMRTIERNFRAPLLDLTGGLDSRALLGAGLRAGSGFQTAVNGNPDCPDVVAAGRIAREFRLAHRNTIPQQADGDLRYARQTVALTDGEADAFEYARIMRLHQSFAAEFDVSINGSNGEICKGYWWELLFPRTGWRRHLDERLLAARRFAVGPARDVLDHAFDESLVDQFAGTIRRANATLAGARNTAQMDNIYLTLRMQRWQGRIASSTMRIWPCVSPFMWRLPMEAALSAPIAERVHSRMSRRLIEHFDPRLASLPLAQGYPALPVRPANLHRFLPMAAEFGGSLIRHASARLGFERAPAAESGFYPTAHQVLNSSSVTAPLYRKEVWNTLSAQPEPLLRRMCTLELVAQALRG